MTSKPYVLMLKLTDKVDLRWVGKVLLYQILVFIIHGKTWKAHTKMTNLKYQLQRGMINLNCLMDHILYQIFKTILIIFKKNNENTNNSSIRIYLNKFENRITFKIKTKYYLELWTPETMKLGRSIWNKIKIKMVKMNHI